MFKKRQEFKEVLQFLGSQVCRAEDDFLFSATVNLQVRQSSISGKR